MKCLILGGAGFLGQNIALSLANNGCFVKIFDRDCAILAAQNHPRIACYNGLFEDIEQSTRIFDDVDIIWHLISTTVPGVADKDPIYDVATNVLPTLKLLQLAVKNRIKKVMFFSSGGTVYGIPNHVPISESHCTDPVSAYGIHKLTIEKYLHLFHQGYGLDYNIFRVSNPYGRGSRNRLGQGVIPAFYRKIIDNEPVEIWGDGKTVRDYIYIDDLVSAVLLAMNYSGEHKIFNIGSGIGHNLFEVLDYISSAVNKDYRVNFTPNRGCDVPVNVLDISRIREATGWQPCTSLQEGIKQWVSSIGQG
jgi:UDP-glucose 4-epimerase